MSNALHPRASPPSLSTADKAALSAFLGRYPDRQTASGLVELYGLAALLHSHGMKHVSQLDQVRN